MTSPSEIGVMESKAPSEYYSIESKPYYFQAKDAVELLDDMDHFEAWCVGDALAYLVRAGRKTSDPTEDLEKARSDLKMALVHRENRKSASVI